jgi:hypothetical protein
VQELVVLAAMFYHLAPRRARYRSMLTVGVIGVTEPLLGPAYSMVMY